MVGQAPPYWLQTVAKRQSLFPSALARYRRTCHSRHCAFHRIPGPNRVAHNVREWQSRAQPLKAVISDPRQAAARPNSTVISLSFPFTTVLIGRRWATTPSGGGAQKAGLEGRVRDSDRIRRRIPTRNGRGAQARDIVRGEQCRSQAPISPARIAQEVDCLLNPSQKTTCRIASKTS